MKTILSIIASVGLLSLCGCANYSTYSRPRLDVSVDSIFMPMATADTSMASVGWADFFHDSNLQRLISEGLERNTDLRASALKIEEAEATLRASRLAFFPSADLGVQSLVNQSSRSFQIGPSARWEIDFAGKQRNTRLAAEASFGSAVAYSQSVENSLIATIADSYYTLLMLDEQLAISERTLTTWDENIRVMQALKRAGRANEAGVLQAKANRMRTENSVVTLRQQISRQENALRSLLFDPQADLSRGTLCDQTFPDTLAVGVPLELLNWRPDLREAEYALQQSFYRINVARAAFYPSVVLSGSAGWTAQGGAIPNPGEWIASALGSVTQPLFNRGTNTANLRIANAQYEESLLDFEQKLVDAGIEVNDAVTAWQSARQRLVTDKKQIVALKGAVHNTRLLMRNSPTNYLEVLTAQQRLLEAELTEATDRYEIIQAVIALYHALGGGSGNFSNSIN